ncbi:hypothetical protein ACIXQZ_14380, partial [Bacteroides fragilis]
RTEKLSLITPMVLRNSGRVGSRRFFQMVHPLRSKDRRGCLFYTIPCLTRIPEHLFLGSSDIFQIQPSVFRLYHNYVFDVLSGSLSLPLP